MPRTTFDRESRKFVSRPDAHPLRLLDAPLLTAEEECELARAVAKGDVTARDRLVQSNLRLVIIIARDYLGRGLVLDDLAGEGNLGLFRAAKEYDPSFGCRSSTYASYWIKQAITAALINTAPTIRLPSYMVARLSKWREAERALTREVGHAPIFDRVAAILGLTDVQRDPVGQALRTRRTRSGVADDDRAGAGSSRAEAALERSEASEGLRARIAGRLDAREHEVIGLRFGLGGVDPQTVAKVGCRLGITRSWVNKIEARAVAKLRFEIRAEGDDAI